MILDIDIAETVTKGPNASRTKLPFLRPENEKVSVWALIGKFVG